MRDKLSLTTCFCLAESELSAGPTQPACLWADDRCGTLCPTCGTRAQTNFSVFSHIFAFHISSIAVSYPSPVRVRTGYATVHWPEVPPPSLRTPLSDEEGRMYEVHARERELSRHRLFAGRSTVHASLPHPPPTPPSPSQSRSCSPPAWRACSRRTIFRQLLQLWSIGLEDKVVPWECRVLRMHRYVLSSTR